MPINYANLIMGLSVLGMGFVFRKHFKKNPDVLPTKLKALPVFVMTLGVIIAVWDQVVVLVASLD